MNLQQQLQAALLAQQQQQPQLPSFKAGKMHLAGTTVTADPRKGRVRFIHEDQMLKMQWIQRPSEIVEDTIIIFAGEISVELVPECTDGRVLLLRFKNNADRKLFFWLQEADEDKDDDLIKELSEIFTNPPADPFMQQQQAQYASLGL